MIRLLALERHLDRNGTRIVKFFLQVSKEVQKERFVARLAAPGLRPGEEDALLAGQMP